MSQRVDERTPTIIDLDAYNKALKWSEFTMSVCKPKDKNVNNKHVPKRNAGLAKTLLDCVISVGADILEANAIYVAKNLPKETLTANYKDRIKLQENAKRVTFRAEHIMRTLNGDAPFADSTLTFWVQLMYETRALIIKWKECDMAKLRELLK